MKKFVLLLDTPSIKKFVFSTDKMQEISGASGILDSLNRKETIDILSKGMDIEEIYCNGGTGQFIVYSEEAEIENCLKNLQKKYMESTVGTAQIIYGYEIWKQEDSYFDVVKKAHQNLGKNKAHRNEIIASEHTSFMKDCESCAINPAEVLKEKQWICKVCEAKRKSFGETQTQGIWNSFIEYLSKRNYLGSNTPKWYEMRPENFDKIGERYKTGKIALVYADGNSMGKVLMELNSKELSKLFSKVVDEGIRNACYEIMARLCYDKHKNFVYGNILLLGGDDLLVVIPAEDALQFAHDIAVEFTENTKNSIEKACKSNQEIANFFTGEREIIRQNGFTISSGVVIGKAKQPFHMLLEQSEELLKLAKQKGNEHRSNLYCMPSYIDFHDATQTVFSGIKEAREYCWIGPQHNRIRMIRRPYSLEDLKDLMEHAKKIKDSKWPTSKLQNLRTACFQSPRLLFQALLFNLSQVNSEQHKAMLKALTHFQCNNFLRLLSFRNQNQQEALAAQNTWEFVLSDLIEVVSLLPE